MLKHKRFVITVATLVIVPIFTMAIWVGKNDPYWVFSVKPEWMANHHGHNRVLDIRHRLAKPLQVLTRQPEVVILGSSRVYRGMPTNLYGGKVYNFGISSLRIREAYGYLTHTLRWTNVSEVVLGLDYFMFDSIHKYESGYDSATTNSTYAFKAMLTSLLSQVAYDDVKMANSGAYPRDGEWTYSGYKITSPRGAKGIKHVLHSFYNTKNIITDEEYAVFEEILNLCKTNDVKLTLFISPLNQLMLNRMKERSEYLSFSAWKERLMMIAEQESITIFDYSETNPFLHSWNMQGSTKAWIDPSHYAPFVGKWMLNDMGVISRLSAGKLDD